MDNKLPENVLQVAKKFKSAGFDIYVVGGAVRDLLQGKAVDDWDFTTNATPDEILKIFGDEAFYDNKFGTVGIKVEGEENPFEVTTFRTEHGYTDSRRPDKIKWGKSLEDDLKRRDFTVNAMAIDPNLQNKDSLIDPFNGRDDINKKIIKAVGEAKKRFGEDALRMMRAVRIAAELGFEIEEKTFNAIQENADLINKIANERIRDELLKIIASPNAAEGVLQLKNSGLLKEILPELEVAFKIDQKSPGRHHEHDVGKHSVLSLKHSPSNKPIVRLATLLHDIGKPKTHKILKNGTVTFYNHEVVGAKMAAKIADRLRLSKKDKQKLVKLVRWHQFSVDEHQTDKAVRRFIKRVGLENVPDMLDLRTGDRLGGGVPETSWRTEEFKERLVEVQKEPFSIKDLKITGEDVMKILDIKPGPKVGEVLKEIFEEVEDKKLPNERDMLLEELEKFKN